MIVITLASALLLVGGSVSARVGYMYYTAKGYENVIYPDISVQDIDLSGKTREEANNILKDKYGDIVLKKKVKVVGQGKTYTIDYSKLSARYNIEEAVDEALSYARSYDFYEKYKLIKNPDPMQISMKFTYDSKPVKELISIIQNDVGKPAVNASISMMTSGKFNIVPEKNGVRLNTEKLESDILQKINGDLTGDVEIQAPIEPVQPGITLDKLSKINTKLSTFSTSFAGSSSNRTTNIGLATKTINGKVLMPGETFSFNDVVGKRTPERGYKEAPVIIGTKVDYDLGGGICQVSTTLYNAVIRSNIKATERIHHTLPSHYIGVGMDATVDYGNLDYKFKNTLEFPIYLEGYINGTNVVFSVYSDSSLSKYKYDLVNEVYETIQPDTKFVDDPSMPEGQTEVVQPSSIGYKVKVYKKNYENGNFVGQELIANETYNKVDAVIKRGTKKK